MAFDAGFLAAVAAEVKETALGGRVERVTQPERDTVVLQMHTSGGGKRLLINAGSSNPRLGFTEIGMENPQTPPLFCTLLRKHLSGARLVVVAQIGFERVLTLTFEAHDEMGFACERRLVAEIMGKYSNLIFTDGEGKILAVLRPVDFTTSSLRQVLPGMRYELPPPQNKQNPLAADRSSFLAAAENAGNQSADKWLTATYLGISAAVARQMVYDATGFTDTPINGVEKEAVCRRFLSVFENVKAGRFAPSFGLDENGEPAEYAFLPLTQYGHIKTFESVSALLDEWFATRDRQARVRQRAADVSRLLNNARTRLSHKLERQRAELAECANGAAYQKAGDLIVANGHLLAKGMAEATLTDYTDCREDGTFGTAKVTLDPRLTPTANAQKYYKKYVKSKTAKTELTRQIALGEAELAYLEAVETALSLVETPTDIAEIREELAAAGYGSKTASKGAKKRPVPAPMEFLTSGGYRVLCGKNNLQNEYITHKVAEKTDYWFHAKNRPGSHVVLLLEGKGEPAAADFTEAASIAAFYSAAAGAPLTEVDYTTVRNLKKAPGAKPGFVIYHTNWSATVSPNKEAVAALRKK